MPLEISDEIALPALVPFNISIAATVTKSELPDFPSEAPVDSGATIKLLVLKVRSYVFK